MFVVVLAATFLAACGGSSPSTAPAPPAGGRSGDGRHRSPGRSLLDGTPPPAEVIRLDGDPKCVTLAQGEERRTEYIVIGHGNTLQNVFVYVKDGLPPRLYPGAGHAGRARPAEVPLRAARARHSGRPDADDPQQRSAAAQRPRRRHRSTSRSTSAQPIQGMEIKRTFTTREVMVPFKCHVHAWMNAYVGVLEHPFFAVTDGSGRFSIPQLPPGTYTIEAWHERLGTQTQQVTVGRERHEGPDVHLQGVLT